jgi:hypothetical protein
VTKRPEFEIDEGIFQSILDNKWIVLHSSFKGVTVLVKTTEFKNGIPLMNIGLIKDNYWYNYIVFAGDKDYLEEKVDHFLVDYEMKKDWDSHVKELKK